jgi:hypothetical protein
MANVLHLMLSLSRLRAHKTAEGYRSLIMPFSLSTPVAVPVGGFCLAPDTALAQGGSVSSSRGSPPLLYE